MDVLVCHHDGLFLDATRSVLEAEGFAVTTTTDTEEARRDACAFEACLVDMGLAGAVALLDELGECAGEVRALALVDGADDAQVASVLRSGADGWVTTADGIERLVHTLRARTTPDWRARAALERTVRRNGRRERPSYALTARQAEVLAGLVRGESTKALAARMNVSAATARTHVQHLLTKLGVHSRLQAVALALEDPALSSAVEAAERDHDLVARGA